MVWKNDQVTEGETGEILRWAEKVLGVGGDEAGFDGCGVGFGGREAGRGGVVEGDFVEMGCYRGDTSLMLAETLKKNNDGSRAGLRGKVVEKSVENSRGDSLEKKLWIYDSFEGLPEKTGADESALGVDFKRGELAVTKREVKQRFLRAGLPVPVIKKGWFADLTEADLPDLVALAFLDGDLYESIWDCLRLVGSKMVAGGVILVHDYNNPALPGVAKAVDEWMEGRDLRLGQVESLAVVTGF